MANFKETFEIDLGHPVWVNIWTPSMSFVSIFRGHLRLTCLKLYGYSLFHNDEDTNGSIVAKFFTSTSL